MSKKKLILFLDRGRDLRQDYPELAQIPEFMDLTDPELKFVWLMACDTSPIKKMSQSERLIEALKVFNGAISGPEVEVYMKQQYPDRIKAAIDRMAKFDSSVREMAMETIEIIFKNIKDIADTDVTDMDHEQRARYVTLSSNIVKIMPTLVAQMENKFGVRYDDSEKTDTEIKAFTIDELVLQKNK